MHLRCAMRPRGASTMADRYKRHISGTWMWPAKTLMFSCCDCALTHKIKFRVMRDGNLRMRLDRDNRATANKRRGSTTARSDV